MDVTLRQTDEAVCTAEKLASHRNGIGEYLLWVFSLQAPVLHPHSVLCWEESCKNKGQVSPQR